MSSLIDLTLLPRKLPMGNTEGAGKQPEECGYESED